DGRRRHAGGRSLPRAVQPADFAQEWCRRSAESLGSPHPRMDTCGDPARPVQLHRDPGRNRRPVRISRGESLMAELTVPKEHEVPHHFDDLEQEFESHKMGMWLFLASEIMMFGALLVGGFILLYRFPGAFAEGRAHLDLGMGALNTFFLLTSGFTMALAALHGQRSDQTKVRRYLWLSLLFAAGFLVVKALEYSTKLHHGTLPGPFWSAEGFTDQHAHLFFGFYFASTSLHVVHVLIGMGLMV